MDSNLQTTRLLLRARIEWDADDDVYVSHVEPLDIKTWGKDVPDVLKATNEAIDSHLEPLRQLGTLADALHEIRSRD